jgi:magnesium transporter
MQQEFGLHDLAVEDARHGHQRPKVEEYGETLLLRCTRSSLTATDEMHVGEVTSSSARNFVISVRNRSTQNLLRRARAGGERTAPAATRAPPSSSMR